MIILWLSYLHRPLFSQGLLAHSSMSSSQYFSLKQDKISSNQFHVKFKELWCHLFSSIYSCWYLILLIWIFQKRRKGYFEYGYDCCTMRTEENKENLIYLMFKFLTKECYISASNCQRNILSLFLKNLWDMNN